MKKFVVAILALTLLVGCGASKMDDGDGPPLGPKSNIELKPFASCAEMKNHIVAEMERKVVDYNSNRCRYDYGHPYDDYGDVPAADNAGGGAPSYTETNTQEKRVDEADLVKSDGKFLYVTTSTGVDIFKIWPFTEFSKIASIDISGKPESLYLIDDRLVVLSNVTGPINSVAVNIVDISNPLLPKLLRRSLYDGSLVDSRRVDNIAHIVTQFNLKSMPELNYYVPYEDLPLCGSDEEAADHQPFIAAVEGIREDNLRMLGDWDVSSSLINVEHNFSANAALNESFVVDCSNIMRSDAVTGDIFTTVISINLEMLTAKDKIATILGSSNIVYGSADSIYVSAYRNNWYVGTVGSSEDEETIIHRFSLSNGRSDTKYFGSTSVPGHLLNQFSMSEFEGFLRVATTARSANNVYTIDIGDPELPITGKVEDLAPGEMIYAVRFIGPRGFVVTFKKVDPLFTIDLSNPFAPAVTGELKVPGYSTYLHSYDEDNLIGLGFDADDMGNFAWFQGLQLSLFDVGDPANPTRKHNIVIGTRGTNSDAAMDHHAFTFDATRDLLSIPVDVAEGGEGGGDYGDCSYAGVHLYRVTLESGFDLVSEIKRTDLGCQSSWWTSTSQAKRSIILGDGVNEGVIVVWYDRVDLYNVSDASLIGSESISLPTDGNYYW